MSVTSFSRLGSANAYDNTVANLTTRQNKLSSLQESLSSGKKITSPSDDPTGAAQAERALNRLARIATDQRALEVQRNAISIAESTLGDITSALQDVRDLVSSAGNGSFSTAERKTVSDQIAGLRAHILTLANTQDSNGQPLFAALGSALQPFVGPASSAPDYTFTGQPGTSAAGTYAIPSTLDGESAFMLPAGRDAVYNVTMRHVDPVSGLTTATAAPNLQTGTVERNSAPGAGAIDGHPYTVVVDAFDATLNTVDYHVEDKATLPASTIASSAGVPWSKDLGFVVTGMPGLSLTVKGTPTVGDTLTVEPNASVFSTIDHAVTDIKSAPNSNAANQAVTQALHNIDISMARISAVRGQAGDLLNRADSITSTNDKRNVEQHANQSRAEDIDMIQAVSDFQRQQTGYQAALQSYAQIQKLSLFNFIS
jgi:flagellar hook-associated protein 3 FlgL